MFQNYNLAVALYAVTCLCYSDTEQQLPTDKLHALCGMMAVQQYVDCYMSVL